MDLAAFDTSHLEWFGRGFPTECAHYGWREYKPFALLDKGQRDHLALAWPLNAAQLCP
jgi:hypothetical protein